MGLSRNKECVFSKGGGPVDATLLFNRSEDFRRGMAAYCYCNVLVLSCLLSCSQGAVTDGADVHSALCGMILWLVIVVR